MTKRQRQVVLLSLGSPAGTEEYSRIRNSCTARIEKEQDFGGKEDVYRVVDYSEPVQGATDPVYTMPIC
jgi:hypothetical protein